ncbi:MAG: hypothetical protein KME32_34670 [Mojavia pulchra JT2-VF2]|jgi:hypothetical protein|uniref:Uncharacterized protein n=1 Tax=Mojavia pulchra JT2-VF2 TaxID=287848 RepID=A0A951Q5F1_9NOST|nr:hypothetical protein [Mojavia pulchra JT2-VF2]
MMAQNEEILVQAPRLPSKVQAKPPANEQSQPVTIDSIQQPVKVQQPIEVVVPPTPLANQVFPVLITVFGSFVAAGISSYLAWIIAKRNYDRQINDQKKNQQRSDTFQMAEEFNSYSMWLARVEAHKKFVQQGNGSVPRDIRKDYEEKSTEELAPIFRVIYFYKRLDTLKSREKIDLELAQNLFYEIYKWWFDNYFKHQINYIKDDPEWNDFIVKYDWLYDYIPSNLNNDEPKKLPENQQAPVHLKQFVEERQEPTR